MPKATEELLRAVVDETTFLRFLSALREDCESSRHDCESRYDECLPEEHWQTRSTVNFLRSAEDWATGGDFAEGQHYGEPMLRRIATMLWVGRYLRHEDMPDRYR
jgi:hypothetical protein